MATPIPNIDEQTGAILQALREAAPRLTESVIEVVFWRGVIDTVLCAVGIAIALFLAFNGMRWGKKAAADDLGEALPIFATLGCWIGALIVGGVSLTTLSDAILKIISPEGVAIGRLLRVYF